MSHDHTEVKDDGRPIDQHRSWGRDLAALGISLLICFAVAGAGGLVTTPQIETWYAQLTKPTWTPPDWVFGPVWTLLYGLMAVAAWLIWRSGRSRQTRTALFLFAAQLFLNFCWSWLFFGLHWPGAAVAEIVALWLTIMLTLITFWRRVAAAGWLLVPYLLWVTFAGALNAAVWWLNR